MDSLDDRTNALKAMPLLADLPHGELAALAKRLKVEEHRSGSEIIKQGAAGSSTYFVVSGRCEVRRKGTTKRVRYLEAGDFFGELSALSPAPRSASVIAAEATTVLVLTEQEFKAALKAHKSMAMRLAVALAKRLQRDAEDA